MKCDKCRGKSNAQLSRSLELARLNLTRLEEYAEKTRIRRLSAYKHGRFTVPLKASLIPV